mmetsp:Transcript_8366/g.9065  ORF Transcript_8366/g.9065 Transcript_8366/m.9065 type:complete len:82 (-) Transcript_8366:86-331(-)
MTFTSAGNISELLKTNNTLQELTLLGNNLGNKGVYAMLDGVLVNNSLEKLDLSYNQVSEKTKGFIQENLGCRKILLEEAKS